MCFWETIDKTILGDTKLLTKLCIWLRLQLKLSASWAFSSWSGRFLYVFSVVSAVRIGTLCLMNGVIPLTLALWRCGFPFDKYLVLEFITSSDVARFWLFMREIASISSQKFHERLTFQHLKEQLSILLWPLTIIDLFIFRHTSWGVKDEPEVTPDEGAQGHKVDLALALQFYAVIRYHWPHGFLSQVSLNLTVSVALGVRLSFAFVSTGTGEETEDFSVRSKDLWVKNTDHGC